MGLLSTPLSRAILLALGVAGATAARGGQLSSFSKAASLLGAAVYTGASFWTTFVAGIVMFRHFTTAPGAGGKTAFGDLQAKLFPCYFVTQLVTAGVVAAGVVGGWGGAGGSANGALVAAATSALNLVILEPLTTKAMYARREAASAGGPAAVKANKRFGMLHGLSSAANLVGLIGMVVHLVAVAGVL